MRFLHDCERIQSCMVVATAGMHLEVVAANLPAGPEFACERGFIEYIRDHMAKDLSDTVMVP